MIFIDPSRTAKSTSSDHCVREHNEFGGNGGARLLLPPRAVLSLVAGLFGRAPHAASPSSTQPVACSAPKDPSRPPLRLADIAMPLLRRKPSHTPVRAVDHNFFEHLSEDRKRIEWLTALTETSWPALLKMRDLVARHYSAAIAEMEKYDNKIQTVPCPRILADPQSFQKLFPPTYNTPNQCHRDIAAHYSKCKDRLYDDLVGVFVEYAAWEQLCRLWLRAPASSKDLVGDWVDGTGTVVASSLDEALPWLVGVETACGKRGALERSRRCSRDGEDRSSIPGSNETEEVLRGELFTPYLDCQVAKSLFISHDPWRTYGPLESWASRIRLSPIEIYRTMEQQSTLPDLSRII